MRTDRVPLQGGGWLTWGAPEGGAVEAMAVYSLPPADRPQDEWHLPGAPYPGGGLLHLAARLAACGAPASRAHLSGGSPAGKEKHREPARAALTGRP